MSAGMQGGPTRQDRPSAQAADAPDWGVLKDEVGGIAEAAVERGWHFLDSAREQANGYLEGRKNEVADSIGEIAHSLREAMKPFEDRPNIRSLVDSAAQGLDQVADGIRERSVSELYEGFEDTMRRHPGAFAAGSMVVGFAIARFVKASGENARRTGPQRGRGGQIGSRQGRGRQLPPPGARAQVARRQS